MVFNTPTLFDFNAHSKPWTIVNDVVMGGRSQAQYFINEAGHALFKGRVSLENNGGFASIRYRFLRQDIRKYNQIIIRLKGDGKRYQFRVKADQYHRFSYVHNFKTSGEWEQITIDLDAMVPKFRGNTLNMPNFPGLFIEETAFLIGNKRAESFQLVIDRIDMQ